MRISALTYSRLPGRGIVLCASSMKSQTQEMYANADAVWRKGDRESGRDGKGGKKPREGVERRAVGGRRKVR
jgi:hypothetical protein